MDPGESHELMGSQVADFGGAPSSSSQTSNGDHVHVDDQPTELEIAGERFDPGIGDTLGKEVYGVVQDTGPTSWLEAPTGITRSQSSPNLQEARKATLSKSASTSDLGQRDVVVGTWEQDKEAELEALQLEKAALALEQERREAYRGHLREAAFVHYFSNCVSSAYPTLQQPPLKSSTSKILCENFKDLVAQGWAISGFKGSQRIRVPGKFVFQEIFSGPDSRGPCFDVSALDKRLGCEGSLKITKVLEEQELSWRNSPEGRKQLVLNQLKDKKPHKDEAA